MAPHWGFPRQHRRLLQGDPSWPHELWIEITCAALGSAWWYTYPSEKYESVGMMKFPTEWKKTSSKPPTRDSCQPSMAPKMGISTCGTNISNILSKEQTCQCCTFWVFLHNTKLVGGAITILKNDGVKVNGVGMTSHIWHGKKKIFQTTNQTVLFELPVLAEHSRTSIILLPSHLIGDTLGNRSPAGVRTMETGTQRRGTRSASRFVVCLALLIHHRAIIVASYNIVDYSNYNSSNYIPAITML